MAGGAAHAQQAAGAFYRDHLVVGHHKIHIAGRDKVDITRDLMPTQFTGEGGKIGICTHLLKKMTQPGQQFHFYPYCVAVCGFGR